MESPPSTPQLKIIAVVKTIPNLSFSFLLFTLLLFLKLFSAQYSLLFSVSVSPIQNSTRPISIFFFNCSLLWKSRDRNCCMSVVLCGDSLTTPSLLPKSESFSFYVSLCIYMRVCVYFDVCMWWIGFLFVFWCAIILLAYRIYFGDSLIGLGF